MNIRYRYLFLLLAACGTHIVIAQPSSMPARLASWPAKVEQTGAFYKLAKRIFPDKVSVQETAFSGFNSIVYTLLEDVMPPTWYPIAPKVIINHLDASDALVLSALIPNASIMQESLRLMHISKAFEKCEHAYEEGVRLDGAQVVTLLTETIESKINRCRLVKLFTPAGLIFLYTTSNSTLKSMRKIASWVLTRGTFAFSSNDKATSTDKPATGFETAIDASGAAIKIACAQYSQNQLLKEGIACFKLLLETSAVTIDKALIKDCLTKIANKLTPFDGAYSYVAQYRALAELCN